MGLTKEKAHSYSISGLEAFINKIIGFVFYYRLVVVILAICALITIGYMATNNSINQEKLKTISILLACGSVIIGIFYSVINYEHSQIKFVNDMRTSKKILSYNAASEWFKPAMVENLKLTKILYIENKHYIDQDKALEFSDLLDKNEEARSALVSIFNYLECIAIAINSGVLDEEFMKEYLNGICAGYLANYGFYINYRRNTEKSSKIWIHFTNLATKWQS